MALTVTALGKVGGSASVTTLDLTTTAAAPAGSLVCIGFAGNNNAASISGSDSVGNTYSSSTQQTGNSMRSGVVWSVLGTTIPLGGTITLTRSAAAFTAFCATAFSGPDGTTATVSDAQAGVDQTVASASWSVGPTSTTAQASELAFTAWGSGSTISGSWAATGGFTNDPNGLYTTTGTVRFGICSYRQLTATEAVTSTATNGSSATYNGTVITFKLVVPQIDVDYSRFPKRILQR